VGNLRSVRSPSGIPGYEYDFDDLASAMIRELDTDKSPRRYRHIVIDEGQDLSPEMLRSLAKAIPIDGSITFFGDVAQQIYGHRMSWRSAGLNPTRVWQFTENYRNSREIAALGLAVSAMPYYAGVPDMVAPVAPVAAGPKPTLVRITRAADEVGFVAEQALRLSRTRSVAVLARTVRQLDEIQSALPSSAINLRSQTARWVAGPKLLSGHITPQRAWSSMQFCSHFYHKQISQIQSRLLISGSLRPTQMMADCCTLELRGKGLLILTYAEFPSLLLPPEERLYTRSANDLEIEKSATARGITRLCHFTPSRNLLHIAAGKVGY